MTATVILHKTQENIMREYKILAFSDMHGNGRVIDMAKTLVQKENFDLVVYLGDFSESIGDVESNLNNATSLISSLRDIVTVRCLFGNCDTPELAKLLEAQDVALHNKLESYGKTVIAGWGGSHPTPFHTPSEISESEIQEALDELLEKAAKMNPERLILFTHEPPFNVKGDEVGGSHVGSEALRHIIEKHQPNLDVCGHIHEAKSTDCIGHTRVINVGPASKGHFLKITVDGDVKTEELNI
jgi:hypothetical protein